MGKLGTREENFEIDKQESTHCIFLGFSLYFPLLRILEAL
jgi:hypothetical protein